MNCSTIEELLTASGKMGWHNSILAFCHGQIFINLCSPSDRFQRIGKISSKVIGMKKTTEIHQASKYVIPKRIPIVASIDHRRRNRKGLNIQSNSILSWIRDDRNSLGNGPKCASPTRMTDMEERILESNRLYSITPGNRYQYQPPGRLQYATMGVLNTANRNDLYTQRPEPAPIPYGKADTMIKRRDNGVNGMFARYESLLEQLREEGEKLDIVNITSDVESKRSSKTEQGTKSQTQIQRLKLYKNSTFLPLSPVPRGSDLEADGGISGSDLIRHLRARDALVAIRNTLNTISSENAGCGTTALDLIRSVEDIRVSKSCNKVLSHSRIVDYGNELFSGSNIL